jgi:hypothetical protein
MAAPTLDGKVNAVSNAVGTTTAVLTTTLPDDIIIAIVDVHSNQAGVTVSGVTCDGVAMTQRCYIQTLSSIGLPLIHSVWWLHAALALSAKNIVASYTNFGAVTDQNLTAFGVNGCDLNNPFDPNVSLPAHTQVNNTARTVHNVTYSTTTPNTFVFAVETTDNPIVSAGFDVSPACTGLYQSNSLSNEGTVSEYVALAAVQTGQVWNVWAAGNTSAGDIATIDALQVPAAAPPPPATIKGAKGYRIQSPVAGDHTFRTVTIQATGPAGPFGFGNQSLDNDGGEVETVYQGPTGAAGFKSVYVAGYTGPA